MSHMYFHRVERLPEQYDANAVYFLKGEHEHDMDMFVTGEDPNDALRVMTAKDVFAMLLQQMSNWMQIVVVIPTRDAEMLTHRNMYTPRAHMTPKSYYMAGNMGKRHYRYGGQAIMHELNVPGENRLEVAQW